MPRKTLKERKKLSDAKRNRVRQITDNLKGTESPDSLMMQIMEVLTKEESGPSVGKYYTFIYSPKTPNIRYDAHPLVAVTNVFDWGFRGINFHWKEFKQYTWEELVSGLYIVYAEEIKDLQGIPYKKIQVS
jgi:hypothetical protein